MRATKPHTRSLSTRMAEAIRLDSYSETLRNPVAIIRVSLKYDPHGVLGLAMPAICMRIQGLALAYLCCYDGNDEIAFVMKKSDGNAGTAWLGYNTKKMTREITAIAMTEYAIGLQNMIDYRVESAYTRDDFADDIRHTKLDIDVFSVTLDEACNYLIWRQLEYAGNTGKASTTLPNFEKTCVKHVTKTPYPRFPVITEWKTEDAPSFKDDRKYVDHRVAGKG